MYLNFSFNEPRFIGLNADMYWNSSINEPQFTVLNAHMYWNSSINEPRFTVLNAHMYWNSSINEPRFTCLNAHMNCMKHLKRTWISRVHRFVLAVVSPAVVVPSMLGLSEKGYGLNKGIPTLVIASVSLDAVLAITGFGVMLSVCFSEGSSYSFHRHFYSLHTKSLRVKVLYTVH